MRIVLHALSALLLFGITLPVAVAGDESKPWSQIMLPKPKLSDPRQLQLVMVAVDGKREFSPETFYQLAPGKHEFAVAPTLPGNLGELRFIPLTLDMQPCMNYELIAVRKPGTSRDNRHWVPRVKSEYPIKRCMKKFGEQAKSPATDRDATK